MFCWFNRSYFTPRYSILFFNVYVDQYLFFLVILLNASGHHQYIQLPKKLNIPASTWPILRLLQKISSFKITEEPLVKSWLNVNLYERIDHVKYFLFNQGTIFLTFLGLSFILLIVLFLRFLKVNQEL